MTDTVTVKPVVMAPQARRSGTATTLAVDPDLAQVRAVLGQRTIWHINTTATGGGVAELLRSTMYRHELADLRSRWLVVNGPAQFFRATKQIHHLLHGSPGSGTPLSDADFQIYSTVCTEAARIALSHMSPGDVVVLHDPQVLGMAADLVEHGLRVAWRSHIGTATWTPQVATAWEFLKPFLFAPQRYVFSSMDYVPAMLRPDRVTVIYPTIDPDSAKCRPMDNAEVHTIVSLIGLARDESAAAAANADPATVRYVDARIRVLQDGPMPHGVPMILQLSRWDPLKDMTGVLKGFVQNVASRSTAHLVLAGPDPDDIPDDLENKSVFESLLHDYQTLPRLVRRQVHLAILGLADDNIELNANALIVNALQRRADIITQKSLQEGFGLTVTEAMWKSRPLVASAVGGIREQVVDGVHGLLLRDPSDLAEFGTALNRLLDNPELGIRFGVAARRRCEQLFLIDRELRDYIHLYLSLVGER